MADSTFPNEKSPEPQSHSGSEKPQLDARLNSILLIEDDEIINFCNNHLIEKLGISNHVHVALNGQAALQYLSGKEAANAEYRKPDLILLDINMPIMNGFEFLEHFEKLPKEEQEGHLIVMLTSSMAPEDQRKASRFACLTDYYPKPLNESKIQEIMDKYFPA